MSNTPADRRRAPRITALLKVEYESLEELQSDYLTDLSEGGLFVRSSVPLAVGQELEFTLSFPGLLRPMSQKGVVRSKTQKSVGDAREEGYGVEFVFTSDAQRARMRELVRTVTGAESATGDEASASAQPAPEQARRIFRILLVDDNRVVRDLFSHALQRLRHEDNNGVHPEVLIAQDARAALQHLEKTKIDLLILDHYLPEMSGIELLRVLRADPRYRDLPVMMISSNEAQLKQTSLKNGADLFVSKPVQARTLLSTLRGLMRRSGGDTGE